MEKIFYFNGSILIKEEKKQILLTNLYLRKISQKEIQLVNSDMNLIIIFEDKSTCL